MRPVRTVERSIMVGFEKRRRHTMDEVAEAEMGAIMATMPLMTDKQLRDLWELPGKLPVFTSFEKETQAWMVSGRAGKILYERGAISLRELYDG